MERLPEEETPPTALGAGAAGYWEVSGVWYAVMGEFEELPEGGSIRCVGSQNL